MSTERTGKQLRRPQSSADTARVADTTVREPLSRTVAIVDAALRVWEAKHAQPYRSVWQRSTKQN